MDKEVILEENINYQTEEAKALLGEVRDFFQSKLKLIVPEWVSEKKVVCSKVEQDDCMKLFRISKNKDTLYSECNGMEDVDKVLSKFDASLNDLLDSFDRLLDNNSNLDEESKASLESYASAVDKCSNVYINQKNRRSKKFKEIDTVSELREELQQFFGEIISKYILTVLVDALYVRVKNTSNIIYPLVIKEINHFLSENGVYTENLRIGDEVNPECVEPTDDSAYNVTDDFTKYDTIAEVRRYPYYFSDGTKIFDGSAKIWRRRD